MFAIYDRFDYRGMNSAELGRFCRFAGTECSTPFNISHGSFTNVATQYFYGHNVTYSCDEDYELVGTATRICGGSYFGYWLNTTPRGA